MKTQTLKSRAAGQQDRLKKLVMTQGSADVCGSGGSKSAKSQPTVPLSWGKGWGKYGKT